MEDFAGLFEDLEDPRTGNAKRHALHEILLIALCTVLSGGETCADMALFGRVKPQGPWSGEPRPAPQARPQSRQAGTLERLDAQQAQTRRLGHHIPRRPPRKRHTPPNAIALGLRVRALRPYHRCGNSS